jgi:hypothetical protein
VEEVGDGDASRDQGTDENEALRAEGSREDEGDSEVVARNKEDGRDDTGRDEGDDKVETPLEVDTLEVVWVELMMEAVVAGADLVVAIVLAFTIIAEDGNTLLDALELAGGVVEASVELLRKTVEDADTKPEEERAAVPDRPPLEATALAVVLAGYGIDVVSALTGTTVMVITTAFTFRQREPSICARKHFPSKLPSGTVLV